MRIFPAVLASALLAACGAPSPPPSYARIVREVHTEPDRGGVIGYAGEEGSPQAVALMREVCRGKAWTLLETNVVDTVDGVDAKALVAGNQNAAIGRSSSRAHRAREWQVAFKCR